MVSFEEARVVVVSFEARVVVSLDDVTGVTKTKGVVLSLDDAFADTVVLSECGARVVAPETVVVEAPAAVVVDAVVVAPATVVVAAVVLSSFLSSSLKAWLSAYPPTAPPRAPANTR